MELPRLAERCRRRLTDRESRQRGIGPVCEDREAWIRHMAGGPPPRRRMRGRRNIRPAQTGPDLFMEEKTQ